jgi:Cu+-exporting ATPase
VNLATESASITSTEPIPIKQFTKAVKKMGYHLEPRGSSSLVERQQRTIQAWKNLLAIQSVFGIPLLIYSMAEMFFDLSLFTKNTSMGFQFILASILVVSGAGYYRRGFKHLIQRVPNMDSLVALGTGSAYIYSLISAANLTMGWNITGFQTLYFEAAGTILLFITFGKWLESVARGKTTEALTGLANQMPTEAEVYRNDTWKIIPLADVHEGDMVRVKPHSKIPVDGLITSGQSSVDESAISGESLPLEKQKGNKVIGSSLNLQSVLEIRAEKIGRDSMFGQIITLVENAQAQKPEIQKLVDKIASVFVPIVMSLALLSGIVWMLLGYELTFAINVMISVMIIACPCALGLATPTALVVGSGIAARGGILIKSPDAFQELSKINVMVFDKTGTLTESKPKVVATFPKEDQEYLGLALGLEQDSNHPLSKPLLDYGKAQGISPIQLTHIEEIPGYGPQGKHMDSLIRFQRIKSNITMAPEYVKVLDDYSLKGYTVSAVFQEDRILGLIAFADTLKTESHSALRSLSENNIELALLTGDRQAAASYAAQELGIEHVMAEVLPSEKYNEIKKLQTTGKVVGMIGDGINDAPALVAANVGLSFRGGTDIAINAADIIFMNDSLNNLVYAYRISKATMQKIHQNLFWAFIYNLAGIPLAMGVLYPFTGTLLNPMFAGLAMAFSSVSVVTNTLLLRRGKFFRDI